MTATKTTPTPEPGAQRPIVARLTGDVRIRILASYLLLLTLASLASVLIVRQALLVRFDDRIASDLAQEVQEFRRLAGGIDPGTGRPFGPNVERIFSVYLERNVPGRGEQLLTVPRDGVPRYRAVEAADVPIDRSHISRWQALEDPEGGELETAAGPARYSAIPLLVEGRSQGSFVVAHFTADERAEVDENVRIFAAVAGGVLVLATVLAFLATGRVLAPLRELRDAARSVSGADMTRRIEAEGTDELAELGGTFDRMLDRLEFAFTSQRDFIREVSHELRTPIAVIRGHLELIADSQVTDPAARSEALALATGELDRMTGFVEDLLLLAKSEQPDFLRLETVPVNQICEDALANARGLADRDWRLEASSSPRSIVADHQRVSQAIMSLVRNAIEHTSDGDQVAIGGSVQGNLASLWVRDSGSGIAPDEQRRILERFERGRLSPQRYEGSGLGLAIVRAIAEAHGGRILLQSQLGEGATFTIELPVEGPGEAEETGP